MDRSTLEGPNGDSSTNSYMENMLTTGNLEIDDSTGHDSSSNGSLNQDDEVDKINTDDDARAGTETLNPEEGNLITSEGAEGEENASRDKETPGMSTENMVYSGEDASTNIDNGRVIGSAENEESSSVEPDNNITERDITQQHTRIETQVDSEVDTIKDNGKESSLSLAYGEYDDKIEKEGLIDSNEGSKMTQDSRSLMEKDTLNKESDKSDISEEDGLLLTNNKSNNTSPEGSTVPEINDYISINKPIKRKHDDILTSYEPIDPSSFQTEKSKKRVAGKFIEKFWEPLDAQTTNSLERILNMCLNKTIEKYKGGTKISKKMIEAQHILSKNWLNELNRKSFRSRLNVTNVPLPSSMQSTPKSNDNRLDILNYDHLTRRTQFLETYLLAELKQLSDLETYCSDLEIIYNLDLNYLNEFKKTTDINKSKMIKETINKREKLGLDNIEPDREDIRLADDAGVMNSSFDPNTDQDTQKVLHLIDQQLQSLSSNTTNLTNLNEKLETLYNFLNKC
ncbi:uncharacterized protein AC631_01750 [Debaryomyces fabryi]|uniref:Uncharacterized protein n=1 Tax=Debaryomyces fabryi TaxID=58627 RepID=A0A0V1Q1V8_9ASCO|nr:uncharacterized protein AC631_01750 [Debaryomyces fabryi]KSA02477.1 hypothetical protein AC631_01750 [Debaryomyces fabryi]CUM50345.1 unnamed protein product [Debaryomyces fabryi]